MSLTAIVVVDANWGIGAKGDLLFSLPTDMKHFRALTLGHSVLMGRKTLESFPGGRPLPKRRNLVLTSAPTLPQAVEVYQSIGALLQGIDDEDGFVIGGGQVYQALLPHCQRAVVTRVESVAPEVDTYFPNLDALPQWQVVDKSQPMTENGHVFTFVTYENLKF